MPELLAFRDCAYAICMGAIPIAAMTTAKLVAAQFDNGRPEILEDCFLVVSGQDHARKLIGANAYPAILSWADFDVDFALDQFHFASSAARLAASAVL